MEISIRLIIWLIFTGLFILFYYLHHRQSPILNEGITIALASGGLVTSINLIYILISSSELKDTFNQVFGFDITAFYLGAIATGWVSIQPIVQLFKPTYIVGKVENIEINTYNIIYLSCRKSKRKYRVVLPEDLLNSMISKMSNTNNQSSGGIINLQNLIDNLIDKEIKILDISPIYINRATQELRITQSEQIIIK